MPVLGNADAKGALRCLTRLRREYGQPYFIALALLVLVSLRTSPPATVLARLGSIARLLQACFREFSLTNLTSLRPDAHFAAALAGQVTGYSRSVALAACYNYLAALRDAADWFCELAPAQQLIAQAQWFPALKDSVRLLRHAPKGDELHPRRRLLEARREALVAAGRQIACGTAARWAFLRELTAAALDGERRVVVTGLEGRHEFRFWRPLGPTDIVCEYLGSEPPATRPWLIDLVLAGLLGTAAAPLSAKAWLAGHGLPEGYFRVGDAGILRPSAGETLAVMQVSRITPNPCFALSPVCEGARFGHVATTVLLDNGGRLSELAQLTEPEVGDGIAWYTAIAKGGKEGEFHLSPAGVKDVGDLAATLRTRLGLEPSAPIPEVGCRDAGRSLPAGRYLFQWRGRHLHGTTLTACIRFIAHGLAIHDGRPLHLHPHLFRHFHANWLCEAGVPIATIAAGLHHDNIETTYRYLRPTRSQVRAAARLAARRFNVRHF